MDDSSRRLEARLNQLENVMDAKNNSVQDLAKVVRELLELRDTFYSKLESRPAIKEGITKYQKLLQLADENEGISNWTTAARKERLLQELPQLQDQKISEQIEGFNQLKSFLDKPFSDNLFPLIEKRRQTDAELRALLEKVGRASDGHDLLVESQDELIVAAERKLMDLDSSLDKQ